MKPLSVDLDGTLIKSDMLYEQLAVLLRSYPWKLFLLPIWLLGGIAALKRRIADAVLPILNVELVPLNEDLVDYLKEQKLSGRRIELVTATDQKVAELFETRLKLFDEVVGSDGKRNLKGSRKAAFLAEKHPDGFVYAGDSTADLKVWAKAEAAILVGSGTTLSAVERTTTIEAMFGTSRMPGKAIRKGMRLHQWAKNGLIFVPLLLSSTYLVQEILQQALLLFLWFSIVASGTYILNDLLDLEADRAHRTKRNRPLASGELPLLYGLILAPSMIVGGLAGAALISWEAGLTVLTYLVLTISYSFIFKRHPVVDVLVISTLFTLRLVAGQTVVDLGIGEHTIPAWLIVFSVFFFTSLALVKRYTEVRSLLESGREKIAGRGYRASDGGFVLGLGVASGVASILVFMLYLVTEPVTVARLINPVWLWVVPCVLAYWLPYVWLLATRDQMDDDPVVFALKDRASLVLGVIAVGAVILAAWPT